jgi:predicted RNA-binding protein with PUA domain
MSRPFSRDYARRWRVYVYNEEGARRLLEEGASLDELVGKLVEYSLRQRQAMRPIVEEQPRRVAWVDFVDVVREIPLEEVGLR